MAKKPKSVPAVVVAAVVESTAKVPSTFGVKGLKGIPLSATITVLVAENPKRKGCAAEARFALYQDGMTQEEFLAAGGTTPDLAYDTAHGFIAVEGHDPKVLPAKKERAPKAEKPAKVKKVKTAAEPTEAQQELEATVEAETID